MKFEPRKPTRLEAAAIKAAHQRWEAAEDDEEVEEDEDVEEDIEDVNGLVAGLNAGFDEPITGGLLKSHRALPGDKADWQPFFLF